MKTLIVYYSRDGGTRKVSAELKTILGADIEEIKEPRGRAGPVGWMRAGMEASRGNIVPIDEPKADPSTYDAVLIGTPIWAWTVSNPVRSYIAKSKDKLPRVAFFYTMGSSAGGTLQVMEELTGRHHLATLEVTENQIKSGEYKEKAKTFADVVKLAMA